MSEFLKKYYVKSMTLLMCITLFVLGSVFVLLSQAGYELAQAENIEDEQKVVILIFIGITVGDVFYLTTVIMGTFVKGMSKIDN